MKLWLGVVFNSWKWPAMAVVAEHSLKWPEVSGNDWKFVEINRIWMEITGYGLK